MKKLAIVFCLLSFVGVSLGLAGEEPIGRLFQDKIDNGMPVKIYIKDVINQSGQNEAVLEAFKEKLGQSLARRRAIKFERVNNPAESDIQMSAVIKKYQYSEKGPLKPTPSIGTTLLDAAATMTENYVEMVVEYTVFDTKSDKELWKDTVSEYIKKKMTAIESVPLICDVVTRTFIWKCFGKANLKDSNHHDAI